MPIARSALITGLTGQDGSYLAELLLGKGYTVTGVVRKPEAGASRTLAASLSDQVRVLPGDIRTPGTLRDVIDNVRPAEIYHLAGPSFVPASWDHPGATFSTIVGSCAEILEAVRDIDLDMRVFVASSGAMFGNTPISPRSEDTPFRPTTPYAIARLAAHQLVGTMRQHDGLYACSGILFNHESERRPEQFVTRKVTLGAVEIKRGKKDTLALGDTDAVRDWSFAGDIMAGAWQMLQQPTADDYVLASGKGHTVGQLVETAFGHLGIDDPLSYVVPDPTMARPEEPPASTPNVGDPTKASEQLGWEAKVSFEELIQRMVDADLRSLQASATRS